MPENPRKKVSVSILTRLLPALEADAKRKRWDLDAVVEEAFILYLEGDKASKPKGK